jgi:hypothetical protein
MSVGGVIQNLGQAVMLRAIEWREFERGQGRVDHVVDEMPDLVGMRPMFLGSFSWTACDGKERWCLKQHCISSISGQMTWGDMARSYIAIKYPDFRGRVTSAQYDEVVKKHRRAPLYAQPCRIKDALYLDLKSAYWSIMQAVGWDCEYFPGQFLGVGDTMEDFPYWMYKLARNCLVTSALPGKINLWDGQNIQIIKGKRGKVNLVLYALIMDVLNGVASEMVEAGAMYVATDGYIIPTSALSVCSEIAASWGLPLGIKNEGEARIYAPNTYTIGTHEAIRKPHTPIAIDHVNPVHREWLKKRIRQFANQRLKKD